MYRCVYTVHVGYIHYSRPCRARDAGAVRAETRTAHRRTLGARREDERCRSSRYAVCERGTLDIIDTVQGKGSFVAGGNLELLREERLRQVEGHLARAVAEAENAGIEAADLHAMLDVLLEEN